MNNSAISCGYAMKNLKGQYAGNGNTVNIVTITGERVIKTIKSIQYAHIVNFTDNSKIHISNIKDFRIVDQ